MQAEAEKVRQARYSTLTRDFAQKKTEAIENKKRELANRGIPYSEDPNSPYQKAFKNIEQNFADMDAQAQEQAMAGGNETIATLSGASTSAYAAFMQGMLGMTDAELKKLGMLS